MKYQGMDDIQTQFSVMFEFLESNNCLCEFTSEKETKDIWSQMYRSTFGAHGRSDDQLLCISFVRLTEETYVNTATTHQCVCSLIQQLFEMFSSEDLWNLFIHSLENSKDQYLVYTSIKAFSVVLYASSESLFEKRISQIFNTVKGNIFDEKYSNFVDFFSNLVDFDLKSCETSYKIHLCNNKIPCASFSFKDLFQNLCMQFSQHWNSFMNQFYETMTEKSENTSLTRFLILWQKLTISQIEKDLFHLFLNEQYVIGFFSTAYNLDVISLRVYADIIMQTTYFRVFVSCENIQMYLFCLHFPRLNNSKYLTIDKNYLGSCVVLNTISTQKYWFETSSELIFFMSSPNMEPSQKNSKGLEAAVTSALDNNFFSLLPRNVQITGFCIMSSAEDGERCLHSNTENVPICDAVIVKKVVFVFLNIIIDIKNKQLLSNSVQRTFSFMRQFFCISSDEPVCRWILDVFIDQDDILLGIMLALLRIYIILIQDSANSPECTELQNSVNPHGIFISFLQRIGYDHNELLAFLTSDETCFLLYLVQYLKLLFNEWDVFKEIHKSLVEVNEDVAEFNVAGASEKRSLEITHQVHDEKPLVSYSSSSSSSEDESASVTKLETLPVGNIDIGNITSFHRNSFRVLETLVNLKRAISKLVDAGAFPYNIEPLILLLQDCENYYKHNPS